MREFELRARAANDRLRQSATDAEAVNDLFMKEAERMCAQHHMKKNNTKEDHTQAIAAEPTGNADEGGPVNRAEGHGEGKQTIVTEPRITDPTGATDPGAKKQTTEPAVEGPGEEKQTSTMEPQIMTGPDGESYPIRGEEEGGTPPSDLRTAAFYGALQPAPPPGMEDDSASSIETAGDHSGVSDGAMDNSFVQVQIPEPGSGALLL